MDYNGVKTITKIQRQMWCIERERESMISIIIIIFTCIYFLYLGLILPKNNLSKEW